MMLIIWVINSIFGIESFGVKDEYDTHEKRMGTPTQEVVE